MASAPNHSAGSREVEPQTVTAGDAVVAVAREGGPEAAGLLAHLMEQNRRDAEAVHDSLLASAERQREEWKARALAAEERLDRIHARIWDLLE